MKKFFRKLLAAGLIAGSLLAMPIANAEVQTYTGVGEYYMSDFETPNVAQQRAKQRAEQDACEQAGVYVKSFSRMKNSKLIEDEIVALTSGILKIIDVQYQRENSDKTTLIRVTIQVNIDSDDVLKWLQKSESAREDLVAQNEELRKANAAQEQQIAALKQQLADLKTQQDMERITQAFAAEDKIFLSNQKVAEGWKVYNQHDYNGAIKIFSEAIELNPQNALAYYGRAYAYDDLKNYPKAIEDCTKAVQYKSTRLVDAYNNRGEAYRKSGDFNAALADFNKAIELNPNYHRAYNNRGIAYRNLGNYTQAFADYDKAVQLKPDYALAYYNRGYAHRELKNYAQAVADFSKYIELVPNDLDAYAYRGQCYRALGDETKAQADFAKVAQLSK